MRFHCILGGGKVVKDGKGILMLTCLASWSFYGPSANPRGPCLNFWMKLQIPEKGYLNCWIHLSLNYQNSG